MNLALFLDCWTPMKNGVITSVQQLREGLVRRGHRVVIIAVQMKGNETEDPDVLLIPQIEMDFGSKQGFGLAIPVRKHLLKFLKKHEVGLIHTHTEFGLGFAGRWAAKKLGVPRVTTTHTMFEMYSNYSFVLEFKSVWRAYYRHYMRGTSVIVAPSLKAVKYNELVVPKLPVQVVPNGIDMAKFVQNPLSPAEIVEERKRLGIAPKDKVVVFVGRLGPEKRVEELLGAVIPVLRRREDVKMLFVGDGPSMEALKAEALVHEVGSKVIFTGFVDWKVVYHMYSISDLFVTASLSEVHSMTLIEAAMCGLPTVARKDDSNIDLVIDGRNGWLVESEAELEAKVDELVRDHDELERFGHEAHEVSKLFTAERHVERMEKLYRRVIETYPDHRYILHAKDLLDS